MSTMRLQILVLSILSLWMAQCAQQPAYDLILRGGTVYDGSGAPGRVTDLAIQGDRIARIGDLGSATAKTVVDAKGLAIAPGFINMMSWANESLLEDGRSQSDIRQGLTLEVIGEGKSMGPLSPKMNDAMQRNQDDIKYKVAWNTLGEYPHTGSSAAFPPTWHPSSAPPPRALMSSATTIASPPRKNCSR